MPEQSTSEVGGINLKDGIKMFFAILGLVVLILASEAIYQFRNNKDFQVRLYLSLARFLAQKSYVKPAVFFLERAAEIRLSRVGENYTQIYSSPPPLKISLSNNKLLLEDYRRLIKDQDVEGLMHQFPPVKWGKLFYLLGLSAYKNKEFELVIPFWQAAVYLAPEWSHFHIELANYYLSQEKTDSAREQIEFCLKFYFPQKHCSDFLKENVEKNSYLPIGFLESEIINF